MTVQDSRPLRIAYADPPYPGMSRLHYGDHADYGGEVDHPQLIASLTSEYPDGWALSTKTNSLRDLLPLCPDDVRIGAWVKPFAVIKKNVRISYAWEPVIWRGGRKRGEAGEGKDWVSANIVMRNHNNTKGSKPPMFCFWLFSLLGMRDGDELVDLFPGSGAVTDAWNTYRSQVRIPYPPAMSTPKDVRNAQEVLDCGAA